MEIFIEILKSAGSGEATKTKIMYECNLSYAQLITYIEILEKNSFLKREGIYYSVTEKGFKYVKTFLDMQKLFSSSSHEEVLTH